MKECKGGFVNIDGEVYYKISNYDLMPNFFMTITSSSDIWNFCWSFGGVTAGRVDKERALFPYYTADKISDAALYTGPYTAIAAGGKAGNAPIWEPFAPMNESPASRAIAASDENIERNIYKNSAGSVVIFEEINHKIGLSFCYSWTSSAKFGAVRRAKIKNIGNAPIQIKVLDGCRNIMAASCPADIQNANSVLLDAYKKTETDSASNIALFMLSSVLTDRAEPSEGLWANVCWFSTDDVLITRQDAPDVFCNGGALSASDEVRGGRPACFIVKEMELPPNAEESWYQVLDAHIDALAVVDLQKAIKDRKEAVRLLEEDIAQGEKLLKAYAAEADGIQETADMMTCMHHEQNVMMNIMRGGFIANNGKINIDDFLAAAGQRCKAKVSAASRALKDVPKDKEGFASYDAVLDAVKKTGGKDLLRIFYEYMPITFSRRHGDPSRPWNKFSIKLRDKDGNPVLNYEGNWRDIFQNWEALSFSYPKYVRNMCAKFLNAMTSDGYNPYRISREGVDWEVPDPSNPWSFIGYWGDHQVIYLCKLLEMLRNTSPRDISQMLSSKEFASANVPYRIKSYAEIAKNPRDTIVFDKVLSDELIERAAKEGSDAKLVPAANGSEALVNMAAKVLQIIIAKAANFVPAGGIWLNTQRPEWNDANNALAGWGLSIVTLCYLRRFIVFLIDAFSEAKKAGEEVFALPKETAKCFTALGALYEGTAPEDAAKDDNARRAFLDTAQAAFEAERKALYDGAYNNGETEVSAADIIAALDAIKKHSEHTIRLNRRGDGLYHSYNTLHLGNGTASVARLQEMLEGQVAVLSSGLLTGEEALDMLAALKKSDMYEKRQSSYMLYPNKALPRFMEKNRVSPRDVIPVSSMMGRTKSKILLEDANGVWHFNADFRNASVMEELLDSLPKEAHVNKTEKEALLALYEKTFNHRGFTGRSGTFFAYEGLGSIYWHMVSKLLLAVQENITAAIEAHEDANTVKQLIAAYYDVRGGLGFNKSPALYGAFPADPYSHTPSGQGAKQPGMTGQVKEEVLTRWGELGVSYSGGIVSFLPAILRESEFQDDGTLHFTLCGVPVSYTLSKSPSITVDMGDAPAARQGCCLTAEESSALFARDGKIKSISVGVEAE